MHLLRALLVLLALATPLSGQDGRTLHWNQLQVTAHLDAEGRLRVSERHAMVFDGAWNGGERRFEVGLGQQLELHELVRIDTETGQRIPLIRADPDEVDEYDWADNNLLRWRSRAESAPPFRDTGIVYEITYTLWPVLAPTDGGFLLQHDFAFDDRAGPIQRFQVDLTFDDVWTTPYGAHIREAAGPLPPGRGYVLEVEMSRETGTAMVAAPRPANGFVRAGVALGAIAVPMLVFLGLRRRGRELDFVAPLVPPDSIDHAWLETEIFSRPAEVVGTAWDREVGGAEVAALLARLVAEGKLSSRVEPGDDDDAVLHLRRLAPLEEFPSHERKLLEKLFFDGRSETDTASVREHYKKKGFDPAGIIRKPLLKRLDELPGEAGLPRSWKRWLLLLAMGGLAAMLLPDSVGRLPVAAIGTFLALLAALFAVAFADNLSKRVVNRGGLLVGTVLTVATAAALLVALAVVPLSTAGPFAFYRPGPALLTGLLAMLAGVGGLAVALAGSSESVDRLGYRRRLVSAREFFRRELDSTDPDLQDAWFPYLLAFGLNEDVERWFEEHARGDDAAIFGATTAAGGAHAGLASSGSGSGGWTGGGAQFGGGSFGGGGAGGGWGMAAAGMAAGVAAPGSTGGGGGGASVSGGGGGGGW